MSEHIINSHGKIYSDLAKRLGVIVQQYDLIQIKEEDIQGTAPKDTEKYETTLYICVLQNLLTQFKEVNKWANRSKKKKEEIDVEPVWDKELPFWGINVKNCKYPNPTIGYALREIRHILSHPLPMSNGLEYESVSIDGKIVSYNFIRRDQQKNELFRVELPREALKTLVAELSKYLSEVAKVVIKTNEDS